MTAFAPAHTAIAAALARALAPRVPLTVSQWADLHRRLSSKGSAEPGRWRTDRNPPLREPMDCLSARSPVKDVVLMFPIQFGKTEVLVNGVGYTMEHNPGPGMVALPGEVSMLKWINQKLNPMLEETPSVRSLLSSTASRDGANRREFKDYDGGQLYIEHAGSPSRLKSTSVRFLGVDELDEFATNFVGGDDPLEMLEGRTSAFPATYKRLYISTPQLKGTSRIEYLWEKSDQRRFHVPCPHCGEMQPLVWSGLQFHRVGGKLTGVAYVCRECGAEIDEHHKTAMIAAGRWVPENPESKIRGYTINCLYYQIGLGPRWIDLAERWLEVQGDPAKLKTFVNDRLAEPWEDPTMRAVKHNLIADRAEPYLLRTAPAGVLAITAGVDTQDDRLEVQLVGWGRGMRAWVLDYVVLPGDPAADAVWEALDALLGTPIQSDYGCTLDILATAQDAGGHRTEAVKANIRRLRRRRHFPIFGAVPNNAPVLSKGKMVELNWKGQVDKHGIMIYHVGTVGIKHWLYSRLSTDADKPAEERNCHFSDQLPPEYFTGLTSETYNPAKNRFDKKRGLRNEPLDTFVYAYAAAHHPELRLHRFTKSDWDRLEAAIKQRAAVQVVGQGGAGAPEPAPASEPQAPAGGIRRLGRVGRNR
jgi:phage terminase large subunit GpA-like protein